MSIVVARRKRAALYVSIAGLLIMAAAVSAVSARDPGGAWLRVAMVLLTVGAAMWLPWQALLPAAFAFWLGPNVARQLAGGDSLMSVNMLLELPGLLGLAVFAGLARKSLTSLEQENLLIGATSEEYVGIDRDTGVYEERLLRPALDAELARSQRFGHQFALLLVGIDELRQRFDYRDATAWTAGLLATARLLRSTRTHVDRVYRWGPTGFAILLPESGEREVKGLIRRLRRDARRASPREGEPGGPLPTHFGATFFPHAATTVDDLMRRAEVALRLAERSGNRTQIDGAEAVALPAPETLRRPESESETAAGNLAIAVASVHDASQPTATPAANSDAWQVWSEGVLADHDPNAPDEEDDEDDDEAHAEATLATPAQAEARLSLVAVPPVEADADAESDVEAVAAEPASTAAPVHLSLVSLVEDDVEEPTQVAATTAPAPAEDDVWAIPATATTATTESTAAVIETPAAVEAPADVATPAEPVELTPAPLDDAVSDLLRHLDETLDLIRTMKSAS